MPESPPQSDSVEPGNGGQLEIFQGDWPERLDPVASAIEYYLHEYTRGAWRLKCDGSISVWHLSHEAEGFTHACHILVHLPGDRYRDAHLDFEVTFIEGSRRDILETGTYEPPVGFERSRDGSYTFIDPEEGMRLRPKRNLPTEELQQQLLDMLAEFFGEPGAGKPLESPKQTESPPELDPKLVEKLIKYGKSPEDIRYVRYAGYRTPPLRPAADGSADPQFEADDLDPRLGRELAVFKLPRAEVSRLISTILGMRETTDDVKIYRALLQQHHPDRGAEGEDPVLATNITALLNSFFDQRTRRFRVN